MNKSKQEYICKLEIYVYQSEIWKVNVEKNYFDTFIAIKIHVFSNPYKAHLMFYIAESEWKTGTKLFGKI